MQIIENKATYVHALIEYLKLCSDSNVVEKAIAMLNQDNIMSDKFRLTSAEFEALPVADRGAYYSRIFVSKPDQVVHVVYKGKQGMEDVDIAALIDTLEHGNIHDFEYMLIKNNLGGSCTSLLSVSNDAYMVPAYLTDAEINGAPNKVKFIFEKLVRDEVENSRKFD